MLPELSSLPVVRSMDDGESGLGFLLRCAHANGLSMKQLMTLAGVRTPTWLQPADIVRLAFLVGIAPARLAQTLRQRRTQLGRREFEFAGHRWTSAAAFRTRAVQICPKCLREQGHCPAVWELAACSVCPRHQCELIDHCRHCGTLINWARPTVDVCRCGLYLVAPGPTERIPRVAADWCRWLEHQCGARSELSMLLPDRLSWLASAGPDGAFHILMALGIRQDVMHSQSTSDTVRMRTPAEMTQCVVRAFERMGGIGSDSGLLPRELVDLVDQPRLERLACFGALESARRVARQLLRRMRCESPLELLRRPWRTAPPFKGQLELFDYGRPSTT